MTAFDDEPAPALGSVLVDDRGSLPFALLHGESLVACAAWALGAAEVELLDGAVGWDDVRDSGRALVLHDSLCPAAPPALIARCVRTAVEDDVVTIAVRPVVDTVKEVDGDRLGTTVDRSTLVSVASPLVLPARVVAGLASPPATGDLTALVARLEETDEVRRLEASPEARRVVDEADLAVLAAATVPLDPR